MHIYTCKAVDYNIFFLHGSTFPLFQQQNVCQITEGQTGGPLGYVCSRRIGDARPLVLQPLRHQVGVRRVADGLPRPRETPPVQHPHDIRHR